MTTNQYNKIEYDQIRQAFSDSIISGRILFLGIHGSSLFKTIDKLSESDFDIELILDKSESDDYRIIKQILDSLEFKIECQLRYYQEIYSESGLIHKTAYKIFMFYAYSNAMILIGTNVYLELLENLDIETIRQSYLVSAQIAFKDIRKMFFSNKSPYEINKQVLRFLVCTCSAYGYVPYENLGTLDARRLIENHQIIDVSLERFDQVLTEKSKDTLRRFKKDVSTDTINYDIFNVINLIGLNLPNLQSDAL